MLRINIFLLSIFAITFARENPISTELNRDECPEDTHFLDCSGNCFDDYYLDKKSFSKIQEKLGVKQFYINLRKKTFRLKEIKK